MLLHTTSICVCGLVIGAPQLAWAQNDEAGTQDADKGEDAVKGDAATKAPAAVDESYQIIVIGSRLIVAALRDVEVEQEYDGDRITSYGLNSAGELVERIAGEHGEQSPAILVNGSLVSDLGDIADLPIESIKRVEVLPQGSAARIGGPAGQRAYNVVLKSSIRMLALTASGLFATEGDLSTKRGDTTMTWIKGQDRINLSVRMGRSDPLFEADRGLRSTSEFGSFSPDGNVLPLSGSEVDPALSALAGRSVNSVALSGTLSNPTLSALLPNVNRLNPSESQFYRTLRGETKNTDVSLSGAKQLNGWLSLSFNGRLGWNRSQNTNGLASGRFLVTANNAFTPFSTSVLIAQNDRDRALQSRSKFDSGSLSMTLNGNIGLWRTTLTGRYEDRRSSYTSDRLAPGSIGLITVPQTVNPFDGNLVSLLQYTETLSNSRNRVKEISEELEGPLFKLPAGPVRLSAGAGLVWTDLYSVNSLTGPPRAFDRTELSARAALSIPLTASDGKADIGIGATDISAEYGMRRFDGNSRINRHSFAFNWLPNDWLRLSASTTQEGRAVALELLGAPSFTYDNVRYFDPLTNSEAFVTTISGGLAGLQNETSKTDKLSLTARPWSKYGFQFGADYVETQYRNQVGSLPSATSAVMLAFPERFQRDASGRLILVDNRTVTFDRQRNREMRLSLMLNTPIGGTAKPAAQGAAPGKPLSRPLRPMMLNLNVGYNHLFSSTTVMRPGLPTIDLLSGGAIGIGGGRQRYSYSASASLSQGGHGVRLNWVMRSKSFLNTGSLANPDRLTFNAYSTFDLRTFAEIGSLFPKTKWLKNTRVSLSAENLLNDRQGVSNLTGNLPIYFQPRFRDPIGRTITVELRKVF
jgi:hypothetical protein